ARSVRADGSETLVDCASVALCGNEDPEIISKSGDRFAGRTAHCSVCQNIQTHSLRARPNHRAGRDSMLENTNREDDLFEAALLRSPGPERAAFLDAECRSDPELRARVEMMLEGHLNAKDFLENLPDGVAPEREIASPETAGLEQLGSRIGPYKLLQKLGEGGCGLVYLAEQNQPVRRRVALKVIKLGMDTRSVIARFEAERQALALMDHPNIAKVFDAGTTETGRPYFVMELVR